MKNRECQHNIITSNTVTN